MRSVVMTTITLLTWIVVGQIAVRAESPLQVGGQNERPPFSFTDDEGELRGFDVEIAQALCATMETPCKLVPLDFTDVIPGLEEGRIDAAVASMSITEALAGKVVGVKRGTTHDRYLSDTHGTVVSIRRYSHSDEIDIDLALGRLDLALGGADGTHDEIRKRPFAYDIYGDRAAQTLGGAGQPSPRSN